MTSVLRKYPRVVMRQICPEMEKLIFLETLKMNWGSARVANLQYLQMKPVVGNRYVVYH